MDGVLVGKDAPAVGNVVSAMNLIFCGSYARVQARTGLVAPRVPRQSDGSGLQFWLGRPHLAGTKTAFCGDFSLLPACCGASAASEWAGCSVT